MYAIRSYYGSLVTFSKLYKEVWQKKRGSNVETCSSHTTEYSIDGVPCNTAKEYNDRLLSITSPENMMLLTLPLYFAEKMSMQERRSKLLEIAGDITEYQVITSSDSLKELSDRITSYNVCYTKLLRYILFRCNYWFMQTNYRNLLFNFCFLIPIFIFKENTHPELSVEIS